MTAARTSPFAAERPLDQVELQGVRAYQRALIAWRRASDELKRAPKSTPPLRRRQLEMAVSSLAGVKDKMKLDMDDALLMESAAW